MSKVRYVKMGLGFVRNHGKLSNMIALTTVKWYKIFSKKARDETPSHVFVWFEDENGKRVYFEAMEGIGWRGPLPIEKFESWLAEDDRRWMKEKDLTLWMNGSIPAQYQFCVDMLDYWVYDTRRLALHARFTGLITRRFVKTSPNAVICSEAGVRICRSPRLDLRQWCKKKQADNISPACLDLGTDRLLKENK